MSQALPPPGQRSAVSNAVEAASPGSKLSAMRSATARARRSSLTRRIMCAALLGGRPSSMGAQINPSRTKQNQIKLLGFAWFYSSESGLFNGLRRKKIKISSALSPRRRASRQARAHFPTSGFYSTDSDFLKDFSEKSAFKFPAPLGWPASKRRCRPRRGTHSQPGTALTDIMVKAGDDISGNAAVLILRRYAVNGSALLGG